jgi:hypothetical protein
MTLETEKPPVEILVEAPDQLAVIDSEVPSP